MPGRIFFRDEHATVTSTEVVVGQNVFPLHEILSARGVRRRSVFPLLQPNRFALIIKTASGDCEVLRERNGYVVFQLEKAIQNALRAAAKESPKPMGSTCNDVPAQKASGGAGTNCLEFGV